MTVHFHSTVLKPVTHQKAREDVFLLTVKARWALWAANIFKYLWNEDRGHSSPCFSPVGSSQSGIQDYPRQHQGRQHPRQHQRRQHLRELWCWQHPRQRWLRSWRGLSWGLALHKLPMLGERVPGPVEVRLKRNIMALKPNSSFLIFSLSISVL